MTLIHGASVLRDDLSKWTANLENILKKQGGEVNIRRTSPHKVIVRLTVKNLDSLIPATKSAAVWLAHQKQVSWVEQADHMTVKKTHYQKKDHSAPVENQDKQVRNKNAVVTAQAGPGSTARLHQVYSEWS